MASSRRRRRLVAGAWVAGTVLAVVVGGRTYDRMTAEPDLCDALSAQVPDAPPIPTVDGLGQTAPHWSVVLTAGVAEAMPDGPPAQGAPLASAIPAIELSRTVAADDEGFAAVRRLLPAASRPVADRQRQRVVEPLDTSSTDAEIVADTEHLTGLFADRCTFVP